MAKEKVDTKNVNIVEEVDRGFPAYTPTDKEQDVISAVFLKFRTASDQRDLNFENFDGDNLIEYIDASYRRYNSNLDMREDIEDWQARVNTHLIRNKVQAVLSQVVQSLPIAQANGRGDEDIRKGAILTDLYDYSEELDDFETFVINLLEESIVKGTAIGYEGHETKTKLRRNVEGTGDDITVKTKEEKSNILFGKMVKLEEFYPSSVGVGSIKVMPFCFWRNVIPYQQFLQDFSMFKQAKFVQPFRTHEEDQKVPAYQDFISSDVGEGNVEIIKYYNKDTDEFVMIANGVWLNPIEKTSEEGIESIISPLPFNHKELPFYDIKFSSFGNDFFYGKSLADKLKNLHDVLNVLTNMLLDQSFLTIFPPLLTSSFDSIEDDYLRPGRRTPVDTQGLSIRDSYMKLDLGTPGGWHQFILEYTKKIMEEASVDQVTQGVAGVGERTTAREINIAAEGVAALLGLFSRWIKTGLKRKAMLRCKNILQFWTVKGSPIVEQVLGEGANKEFNDAFNVIKIEDSVMTSGKRGKKIIAMFGDRKKMPTKSQLSARANIFELETGKKIELLAVPPEYLRNFDFDIKFITNPKLESTKESDKALELERVRVYLTFFPELVNKAELAARLAEKFGDDPTKILKDEAFPGAVDEGTFKAEQDSGVPTQPTGNMANNLTRGMRSAGI